MRVATVLFLLVCSQPSWATAGVQARTKNSYFVAKQFVNFHGTNNPLSPIENLSVYGRMWVQAFRALKQKPKSLAPSARLSFSSDINAIQQLEKLKLTPAQVGKQSSHVYTLQLGRCSEGAGVQRFLTQHWLRRKLHFLTIYQTVPKSFQFTVQAEDVMAKQDPLYSVADAKSKMIFIRYGLYENLRDADLDRSFLERQLGLRTKVLSSRLDRALIDKMWFRSVTSGKTQNWELERAGEH